MRIDIVVALVKVDRHAAAGLATVLDDPLGQRLDLVAWNTASALEEGADSAIDDEWADADLTLDARDALAVLVPAAVGDVGGDLLAQDVSHALAGVVDVMEIDTVGRAPTVDTKCSDI